MIDLRPAALRTSKSHGEADAWTCLPVEGFGDLLGLEDVLLAPLARIPALGQTVLYLCRGALTDDRPAAAEGGELLAGTFQRVGDADGSRSNPSSTDWTRFFSIRLRPARQLAPRRDHAWFTAAERRGRLQLAASPEGLDGALWIPQDALIYSSLLETGQHVVCELAPHRQAWLHVVSGSATVLGEVLEASDSAAIGMVRAVGVTARAASEILLFDLAASRRNGAE